MQTGQWRLRWWLCLALVGGAMGCGSTAPTRPIATAPTPGHGTASASMPTGSSEMQSASSVQSVADLRTEAPSKARSAPTSGPSEQDVAAPAPERPGLATKFGEDRQSKANRVSFTRANPTSPFVTSTIWYNDTTGAEAMARKAGEAAYGRAAVELFNGGLVVSLLDESGRVLSGFVADKKPYAIGNEGSRYAIGIQNRTDFNFEIVSSVDGLSVIDGRPAAFDRAGYIIYAHQSITIEGFRTSEQSVAAFRFGKVSQSYSAEMGHGDRNVGVIGVAFFHEAGKTPIYPDDTRLREQANPFPGEYAPPPPGR